MSNRVYLSGGFHSNWQDRVMDVAPTFTYFDPRKTGLTNPIEYTPHDIIAIENSDSMFAYLEKDNPCTYNICLEIGYAVGQNKDVLVVDEKRGVDGLPERYHEFLEYLGLIYMTSFEEAISYMSQLHESSLGQFPRGKGWLRPS